MSRKTRKQLNKEFMETVCKNCKSYIFCGAELVLCKEYEKYIKEKEKNNN